MLHSMTGFGSASGEVDGVRYTVEIRSVNNRYLKTTIKLPDICFGAEARIETALKQRLVRGTVSAIVRMKVSGEDTAHQVNRAALASYLDQLRALRPESDASVRIDLGALLLLPGVCEPPSVAETVLASLDALMGLVDEALAGLLEMRRREGRALLDVLLAQCGEIEAKLTGVIERAPDVVKGYHQRLADRVRELTEAGRVVIDSDALAREVAVFAERSDIAEEIDRLTGHVDQFRQAAQAGGPVGRKLDFIAQEMLREANTIASKANDTEIARAVVDIKTAVDRIKEQVQNAE